MRLARHISMSMSRGLIALSFPLLTKWMSARFRDISLSLSCGNLGSVSRSAALTVGSATWGDAAYPHVREEDAHRCGSPPEKQRPPSPLAWPRRGEDEHREKESIMTDIDASMFDG